MRVLLITVFFFGQALEYVSKPQKQRLGPLFEDARIKSVLRVLARGDALLSIPCPEVKRYKRVVMISDSILTIFAAKSRSGKTKYDIKEKCRETWCGGEGHARFMPMNYEEADFEIHPAYTIDKLVEVLREYLTNAKEGLSESEKEKFNDETVILFFNTLNDCRPSGEEAPKCRNKNGKLVNIKGCWKPADYPERWRAHHREFINHASPIKVVMMYAGFSSNYRSLDGDYDVFAEHVLESTYRQLQSAGANLTICNPGEWYELMQMRDGQHFAKDVPENINRMWSVTRSALMLSDFLQALSRVEGLLTSTQVQPSPAGQWWGRESNRHVQAGWRDPGGYKAPGASRGTRGGSPGTGKDPEENRRKRLQKQRKKASLAL